MTLDPEEVREVRLPTKETVDICEFVDVTDIDPIYYDAPYYVVPKAEKGSTGVEAFTVFREALKKSGKAALGEVVLAGREHLVAIRPYGRGLLMETLRYADELKDADGFFDDIKEVKVSPEQMALATSLIKQKTGSFRKVDRYEDSYEEALKKLVERKLKNLPLHDQAEDEEPESNVISLMDALKRSVEGKGKAPKKEADEKPARKTVPRKKTVADKASARKTTTRKTTAHKSATHKRKAA